MKQDNTNSPERYPSPQETAIINRMDDIYSSVLYLLNAIKRFDPSIDEPKALQPNESGYAMSPVETTDMQANKVEVIRVPDDMILSIEQRRAIAEARAGVENVHRGDYDLAA